MTICGTDEAGRGPLAGAVFAAAVVLGEDMEGLNDSKKLTPKRRDALYERITERALAWSVASAGVAEINELNILEASLLAMRRAVEGIRVPIDKLLVDGGVSRGFGVPAEAVVGGDAIYPCIMAASILAKVSRDRYMAELDRKYPEYGFAKHKGYGTAAHAEAIRRFGLCPEHRTLFVRKFAT